MISAVELAWAAGFFEGEGSVRIAKRTARNMGTFCVDVVNTDAEMIAFFAERWQGRVSSYAAKGQRRAHQRWRAYAGDAAAFLEDIEPYVRSARVRRRIALGLEYQRQKTRDRRVNQTPEYAAAQQDFYLRMATLNLRGAAADGRLVA